MLLGVDYVVERNVVYRQIRNLRARLEHDPRQPRNIATMSALEGVASATARRSDCPCIDNLWTPVRALQLE